MKIQSTPQPPPKVETPKQAPVQPKPKVETPAPAPRNPGHLGRTIDTKA